MIVGAVVRHDDLEAEQPRDWCEQPGAARVGFGACWGTVLPTR